MEARNIQMAIKPSKKILQKYNADLSKRKRASSGNFAVRSRASRSAGIEQVRFPVDGGPERPAAGQQGVRILFAGVFPTILELSRVSAIGWNGFGGGPPPPVA